MNWLDFVAEQWLLVSALSVMVAALIVVEGKKGGQTLSCHQVTQMINQDGAILLDVREAKEFSAGHIVNALNIPHIKLQDRLSELNKHRDKTIIVVDKMGQHAGSAGKILKDNGFSAGRLKGGMSEWTHQNLPVIKG